MCAGDQTGRSFWRAAAAFGFCAALAIGPAAAAPRDPPRAANPPAAAGKGAKAKAEEPGKGQAAKSDKPDAKPDPKSDAARAEPAPQEPPPPPYEPQVLRLAEILGALAYLDDLCGAKSDWRIRMQQLLEAEARTPERKERFAGSFNRSFHDYEQSYQSCTPNAEIVIGRFLSEGGRLAQEIVNRFSAS